mgnify:CR=1 FL=1
MREENSPMLSKPTSPQWEGEILVKLYNGVPGEYLCHCIYCKNPFLGDKRDWRCQECQDRHCKPVRRLEIMLSELKDGNLYRVVREINPSSLKQSELETEQIFMETFKDLHVAMDRKLKDVQGSKAKELP